MVVFSPIATLGPIMEFLILQPEPILTGGTITVFSNWYAEALAANFFSSVAFDSSKVSFYRSQTSFLL